MKAASSRRMLVALDIDGTLMAADGTISAPVREAFDLARAAGHYLVPATGRSLAGLIPVTAGLGLTSGYAIGSNGAFTVRLDPGAPDGFRFVARHGFEPGPVIRQAEVLSPDVVVAVEEPGWGWRVNRRFDDGLLSGEQKVCSVVDLWAKPATRVVLHARAIRRHVDTLRRTNVTVTPAGPSWLDITGPGVTKASALEDLRGRLGVPAEATAAIGDGVNDLEALTWAHRGVAMAHAPASLRLAADEVTGDLADDGAASFLRSLVPAMKVEGLAPLAAQLAVAVTTAPGAAVVRVSQGRGPTIVEGAVAALVAGRWSRHAFLPAASGTLMIQVAEAADRAGLAFPRADLGLRARWTRARAVDGRPCFELPLWWP